MSALGITSVDGSNGSDENDPGTIVAIGAFTVTSDTLIVNGNAWYHAPARLSAGQSQKWRIAVFSDNGSNAPTTTVLGASDEITIDDTTAAGAFLAGAFSGSQTLIAGNKVWIALWFGTRAGGTNPQIQMNTTPAIPPDHLFFNTGTTYSSTGNPSVSSWSDSGSNDPNYVLNLTMTVAASGNSYVEMGAGVIG